MDPPLLRRLDSLQGKGLIANPGSGSAILRESFDGGFGSNIDNRDTLEKIHQLTEFTVPICEPFVEGEGVKQTIQALTIKWERIRSNSPPTKRIKIEHNTEEKRIEKPPLGKERRIRKRECPLSPPAALKATNAAAYYYQFYEKYRFEATEFKHKADDVKDPHEKLLMYTRATLKYLQAVESCERSRAQDTSNRVVQTKQAEIVSVFASTGKFCSQMQDIIGRTSGPSTTVINLTRAFFFVCETVSYYRAFKTQQDSIPHGRKGQLTMLKEFTAKNPTSPDGKKISKQQEKCLLIPMTNLLKALAAWSAANKFSSDHIPSGCFTTITFSQLEKFADHPQTLLGHAIRK